MRFPVPSHMWAAERDRLVAEAFGSGLVTAGDPGGRPQLDEIESTAREDSRPRPDSHPVMQK
ncbi:hypothetical protein GCM10012278_51890 [Nonomuraea glycinis]|uniref:Uncharacterized protein n=1 Tax=Nonomuraea glycinis TaxID=2047744 RepID=A0A918E6N3_9ACTN|nr:hypothetical protein GCM10012278_51890 [Nonomuraea glycinis]